MAERGVTQGATPWFDGLCEEAGYDCPERPPVTEWVTHRTGADPQREDTSGAWR
jgi:hypothetical protein